LINKPTAGLLINIMARKIDESARLSKRNEILDCAQRLIYTTGYEQMSIQDIISQMGTSKGAFYHYFDSKPALLEALLERTSEKGFQIIQPIANDNGLPPIKKLENIIQAGMQWKSTQKPFMMAILKAWYSDENALVRQKTLTEYTLVFGGLLNKVFAQGINEGYFHSAYPEMAGQIVFALMTQMSDSLGYILLKANTDPPIDPEVALTQMENVIRAYTDAVERVLGASPGSIQMVDHTSLVEWLPDKNTK
jgi:AcrR family transcriptional regulator